MKISELRATILFLDNTSTCAHVVCLGGLYYYIWHSNDVTRFGGTTVHLQTEGFHGQVETDETENWNGTRKAESWNGKLKAETEKLETGNGHQS